MATEQEIMDELLASYGGNEMRAYTPGPFEQQEQTIESFLSGIGQFAGEKEIPFLKALADPHTARRHAEGLSFGAEMTPILGDVQAIREGFNMMGQDQPLMGSAFIAGSLFTGMSSAQLKKALEKLKKELNEKIPALRARSQSNWKEWNQTGNKGDYYDAERLERQANRSETRINREIGEVEDRLKQQELPLSKTGRKATVSDLDYERWLRSDEGRRLLKKFNWSPEPKRATQDEITKFLDEVFEEEKLATVSDINRKTGRKAAAKTPEPKGIINATPEIRKLYDDMQRGWKKDLPPEHRQLRKEMSEQDSLINKFLEEEADLDERNQLVQMLLDMKNKKPK